MVVTVIRSEAVIELGISCDEIKEAGAGATDNFDLEYRGVELDCFVEIKANGIEISVYTNAELAKSILEG